MKALFLKEIKLSIFPMTYFFAALSALLLIPSYPYIVGVSYFIFSIQINFNMTRANKDQEFTSMLPISREHIVLSKIFSVVYTEGIQLLCAVPFACITSYVLNKSGNPIGLDANFTFFGVVLVAYSVFNITFLPGYHKTGYKAGIPLLLGIAAYLIAYLILELLISFVPVLNYNLDGLDPSKIGYRIGCFIFGVVMYVLSAYYTYKLSVKRFENVNL